MNRFFVAIVLLFWASVASAQWNHNGQQAPDESWRKSKGKFGAMLLLSDNPEQFMADWEKTNPPEISTTERAERGKPIVAFVIFAGCKEVEAACNSTVDFVVLRPDGTEYASHQGGELWKGKPAPPEGRIQLSVANLGVRIEPQDPPGKYTIKAAVHDLNARETIELVQHFTVADKKAPTH